MALLVSYRTGIAFKSLTDRPSTPSLLFDFRLSIILIVVSSLMGDSHTFSGKVGQQVFICSVSSAFHFMG